MNLPTYNELFSFENLYKAHQKARKCKRHKKDVILFEMNLGNNLWKLKNSLDDRTYVVSGYHHFVIYEPKKRDIQSLHYFDRVVQHCIVDNYLIPLLEKHLIYDNGACRKEKGTDFCRNRVKHFLVKAYRKWGDNFYILKFDVHHYFESIDHTVLKLILRKKIEDKEILKLLENIIDSYGTENKGLPMGNQTSQCFALLYLDQIDRTIKEKYKMRFYSRYMDDGIILYQEKEYLKDILWELIHIANNLKISFNKKTQIIPIKQGFTYLGFKYHLSKTGKILLTLNAKTKQRMRKKINASNKTSYIGYLNGRNCYRFTQKLIGQIGK